MTEPEQPLTRRAARAAAEGDAPTVPAAGRKPAMPARQRTMLLIVGLAVAFVLLAVGSVFAGIATGTSAKTVTPSASSTPEVKRQVAASAPGPAALRTCSVSSLAADPRLNALFGSVIDAKTGTSVWDKSGDSAQRTASTLKVLTAAAALTVLKPDFTISTQVLDGTTPGTIVLVGNGDATLSALPAGQQSVYAGAPRIADLAKSALAAYTAKYPTQPITTVILDSTYWDPSDKWDPSWKRTEQTIGYQSEVTALQVDGDRANPQRETSPRSTDPIARAGAAFVKALGVPGVTTKLGAAENGAPVLATVSSAPVKTLVKQMLLASDNTLAEMLARIVSRRSGQDGSAVSLQQVIPAALQRYGVDTANIAIEDGSGLSDKNAVPAATLAKFMVAVNAGKNDLQYVFAGLSIAGKTGGLADRFTGTSARAAGRVWAKTGWIDTSYSLAGIVKAKDGTTLAFTFYAIRAGIRADAKIALDALATGLYSCGNNLTTN